jgi:hypothetical protein
MVSAFRIMREQGGEHRCPAGPRRGIGTKSHWEVFGFLFYFWFYPRIPPMAVLLCLWLANGDDGCVISLIRRLSLLASSQWSGYFTSICVGE